MWYTYRTVFYFHSFEKSKENPAKLLEASGGLKFPDKFLYFHGFWGNYGKIHFLNLAVG